MNVDAIPLELRLRPQWVLFRFVPQPNKPKPKKEPYQVGDPGKLASSIKPETWGRFGEALKHLEAGRADAVGYAFAPDDGYCGIDLDGELSEEQRQEIIGEMSSYTEASVSGAGYHVICRGSLNGRGKHPAGLGVFDRDRFFVFTGLHVPGTPASVEERQIELDAVLARFLPPNPEPPEPMPAQPVDLDDETLLERAFQARNGADFKRLWNGDTSGHADDHSSADAGLCSHLAYWTGRDGQRIDRLFRQSGLYRPKWERDDYRQRTIQFAIDGCSQVYEEGYRSVASELTQDPGSPESVGGSSGGRETTDSLTQPYRVSEAESLPPRAHRSDSDPGSVPLDTRPFALPVHEFIALEREDVEPLLADVDGQAVVGRHSLTLLGALGGAGKTTWFIDVALHLAAGVDYPPFSVPRPVSVLMIENEGPEDLFAKKLEARLASFRHELKARLDVHTLEWGGFSLANDELREQLTREIAEKGYDLVFGDPLDSLGIEGVGSPADTRAFLELMKRTGLHRSVAWWLNTHPRKEETKEALNEISGAWGGRPDSVMLLRMLKDDRTQIRFPKLRWAKRGKRPSILLAFDAESEAFSYLGEQVEEERDYRAETVELLGDGTWRTPKEIAAPRKDGGIGANVDTIKKLLETHPEAFVSRTGDAAAEVGRSKQATVWQLVDRAESDDDDQLDALDEQMGLT